jgi:hypothetical protein
VNVLTESNRLHHNILMVKNRIFLRSNISRLCFAGIGDSAVLGLKTLQITGCQHQPIPNCHPCACAGVAALYNRPKGRKRRGRCYLRLFEHPGTSARALVLICLHTMKGCLMKNGNIEGISLLEEALEHSRRALNLLYEFQRDETYMPSPNEMALVDRLEEFFEVKCLAARHFSKKLRARLKSKS